MESSLFMIWVFFVISVNFTLFTKFLPSVYQVKAREPWLEIQLPMRMTQLDWYLGLVAKFSAKVFKNFNVSWNKLSNQSRPTKTTYNTPSGQRRVTKVRPLHEHNGFSEDTGDQSDSPPPSRVPVFSQSGQHPFQHLVKSRVILKSQFEQKKLQQKISYVLHSNLLPPIIRISHN